MTFLIENAYGGEDVTTAPYVEPVSYPAMEDYNLLIIALVVVIGLLLVYFIVIRPLMKRREQSKKASKPEHVTKQVEAKDKVETPTSGQTKTRGKIFLSYRRNDSADVTGRIYDRLLAKFGDDNIFKDVDSIPLGANFKDHIDSMIKESAVVLVVIGNDWFGRSENAAGRRIDDPGDFVRLEVAAALNRKLNIVPLLVRRALMPTEEELPEELKPLAYRNGISIRPDPDFNNDIDRLIYGLEKILSAS